MPALEIEIINKLGLHARASAKFVGVAGQFPCQIRAGRTPESMVDAKSIMAMMMLMAGRRDIMGGFTVSGPLRWLGWLTTLLMGAAVVAMLLLSI